MLNQSDSQRIIRNTIYNAIGKFWGILVALLLTPYIIGYIGVEKYGIWVMAGVLTGYFGLLDFGIGTSFVKYISEYHAKKDYNAINQVINTGFIFYTIFTIIIIALTAIFIKPVIALFNIPEGLYGEAAFVFFLGVAIFGITNILSPVAAIPNGLQRMDIFNIVAIILSIPNIIGTILFLRGGYGLPGLMINNAIILAINSALNIAIAFKILPGLRFTPSFFNKEMFKRLFVFGYKLQVTSITMIVSSTLDKFLISHFFNLGMVAFYELGQKIVHSGRGVSLLTVSAIMPTVSELDAKNNREKIDKMYLKGTKYLSLVSIPLMFLIFAAAPSIMLLWMGSAYGISVGVIRILAAAHLVNLLTGVATNIAVGMGKPGMITKASLINTILNIAGSVVLFYLFGFWGIIIGTASSLIIGSFIFMLDFHKDFNRGLIPLAKAILLKPLFAALLAGIISSLLIAMFRGIFISPAFFTGLLLLSAQTIMFAVLYLFIIFKLNYLDEYDKNILLSLMRLEYPAFK